MSNSPYQISVTPASPVPVCRNAACMQVVLRMAANKDRDGKIVDEKITEFANRGYRALGVARTNSMVSHLNKRFPLWRPDT